MHFTLFIDSTSLDSVFIDGVSINTNCDADNNTDDEVTSFDGGLHYGTSNNSFHDGDSI